MDTHFKVGRKDGQCDIYSNREGLEIIKEEWITYNQSSIKINDKNVIILDYIFDDSVEEIIIAVNDITYTHINKKFCNKIIIPQLILTSTQKIQIITKNNSTIKLLIGILNHNIYDDEDIELSSNFIETCTKYEYANDDGKYIIHSILPIIDINVFCDDQELKPLEVNFYGKRVEFILDKKDLKGSIMIKYTRLNKLMYKCDCISLKYIL